MSSEKDFFLDKQLSLNFISNLIANIPFAESKEDVSLLLQAEKLRIHHSILKDQLPEKTEEFLKPNFSVAFDKEFEIVLQLKQVIQISPFSPCTLR